MGPWNAFQSAMRTRRERRLRPETAERLLTTGRDPAFPEFSRLHAAATAPPRPHELAGLDAALAAFREAGRAGRPAATARRRVLRPFTVAAAAAAVFAGGVAVAAETGNLPGRGGTPAGDRSATADPSPRGTRTAPGRGGTPSAVPTPGGPGRTLSPTSPAVSGLCRDWDANRRNPNGSPMRAEAMRDLAAAAGGEERIPAFCAPALATPRSGRPTAPPSTAPPGTAPQGTAPPGTVPPTPSHPAGKGPTKPVPSTGRKGTDG